MELRFSSNSSLTKIGVGPEAKIAVSSANVAVLQNSEVVMSQLPNFAIQLGLPTTLLFLPQVQLSFWFKKNYKSILTPFPIIAKIEVKML
jgi:hypothetical protein